MGSKNKQKTPNSYKKRLNLWLLEGKSGGGWLEEGGQRYKLPVIK